MAPWTHMSDELRGTVTASSLSVAYWRSGALPRARGVITLWRENQPALAFTYADAELARELTAAGRVGLAFTERRGTGRSFQPLDLDGTPRLIEDADGTLFRTELMDEELRRFPPARLLADSPLLRREHWWYLPRLIVQVEVRSVRPLTSSDADHLLVTTPGSDGLTATPTRVVDDEGHALRLEPDGVPEPAPALLFGQDASFPDLERWSQWRFRGTWADEEFHVVEAPERRGLAPAPGLMARWRRHRRLERACRQALAAT